MQSGKNTNPPVVCSGAHHFESVLFSPFPYTWRKDTLGVHTYQTTKRSAQQQALLAALGAPAYQPGMWHCNSARAATADSTHQPGMWPCTSARAATVASVHQPGLWPCTSARAAAVASAHQPGLSVSAGDVALNQCQGRGGGLLKRCQLARVPMAHHLPAPGPGGVVQGRQGVHGHVAQGVRAPAVGWVKGGGRSSAWHQHAVIAGCWTALH